MVAQGDSQLYQKPVMSEDIIPVSIAQETREPTLERYE